MVWHALRRKWGTERKGYPRERRDAGWGGRMRRRSSHLTSTPIRTRFAGLSYTRHSDL